MKFIMFGEESIRSVEEYLQLIKVNKKRNIEAGNIEDFLFRGQKDDFRLIPKIARLQPKENLFLTEHSSVCPHGC